MFINPPGEVYNAILKNLDSGEILAVGTASASAKNRTVTFKSDFVPLYPIGTPIEITFLWEQKPFHRFCGKVFTSDKRLMKLVAPQDEVLPGAELVYCVQKNLTASLTPVLDEADSPDRFFLKWIRPKEAASAELSVRVIEMTPHMLALRHDILSPFEEGQRFTITDLPMGASALIKIEKAYYFGKAATYICRICEISEAEKTALLDFLFAEAVKSGKLF